MYGRLQAQQQVGETGLAGSGHRVGAAAVLPQVGLAGPGQRVAHLVVLSDQLLSGGQGLAALKEGAGRGQRSACSLAPRWFRRCGETHPFRHGLLELVVEETLVDSSFSGQSLRRHQEGISFCRCESSRLDLKSILKSTDSKIQIILKL